MSTHVCRRLLSRVNCLSARRLLGGYNTLSVLSNNEARKLRNAIFDEEKKRQQSLIKRIEKIKVDHKGPPEDCTLIMNKGLSTPYNCAMHIQDLLMGRSALALVNGKPWDMHRPLVEDCMLQFLHFRDEHPTILNNAFWRSCSFVLGHVLETAFKDEYKVNLITFPKPIVQTGSFIYDVELPLPDWKPTTIELNALSRIAYQLRTDDLKFERLDVDASIAQSMFADNPYKCEQIPQIASSSKNGSRVTLYRMGEHIDISRGPLISSTSHIGRFTITAVHDLICPKVGQFQRVQGVALPTQVKMHYWSYGVLEKRSQNLNDARLPSDYTDDTRRQAVNEQP